MAVSSSLAQAAPSVKFSPEPDCRPTGSGVDGREFGAANLNGAGLVASEKVHLDEIAASLDHRRGGAA
jgi:hypothetical protein